MKNCAVPVHDKTCLLDTSYKEILSPEQLDYMMDWMYAPENIRKQMEEEGHVYFIAVSYTHLCTGAICTESAGIMES